jgi:hypothetical protein
MSKGGGTPAATTQTTTSEFPTELRPYITDILERAKGQAEREEEQGYQAYTGPRIAEFEPEQLASQQAIREFAGRGVAASPGLSSAQTYYTPALGLTLGQTEQFGAPQAAQYMSPYQQAVIDVEKREAVRQFQPVQQGIGAQATRAGAFGGSRQAILEAEAGRNLQQQLGDIQTRGLQSAYDRAQSAFEAQKARERGAAGSLAQMGAAIPAQALKEIGALQALGSERQQMAQRALDLGYSQFREEQMFPTRSLQEYQSIIRGFPFTPSTYSTSSYIAPPASLAQNVLGIGTGIAGLAGAFGGFKEGGVVRRQQAGTVGGDDFLSPEDMMMVGSRTETEEEVLPFQEGERRVISKFGKEQQYEFKDGEWYRVKDDNTLAKSPASGLIRGNLMNVDEEGAAESSIVATTEKPLTIGEDRDIGTMLFGPPEETDIVIPSTTQAQPKVTTTTEEITPEVVTQAVETMTKPQPQPQANVDPTKKVPPSTVMPPKPEPDVTKKEQKEGLSFLEQTLKKIQDRETLSPEMKAYQSELKSLREGLGKKESQRKEELKKQKYLQLAEFGRSLLGADTTKGLLAQVAQAGEKPLATVGELVAEEGKLGEKTQAEKVALLKGEADVGEARTTAERQQLADILSVQKAIQDDIESKIKLGEWGAGISSPSEATMINIASSVLGRDVLAMTDRSELSKLETAKTTALKLWSNDLNSSYTLRNDPALADARFREILGEQLKASGIAMGSESAILNQTKPESGNQAVGESDAFAPE